MISYQNGVPIHVYHTLVKMMSSQLIVPVQFCVVIRKHLNVSVRNVIAINLKIYSGCIEKYRSNTLVNIKESKVALSSVIRIPYSSHSILPMACNISIIG